jgi:SAM-dependent methyltransferase
MSRCRPSGRAFMRRVRVAERGSSEPAGAALARYYDLDSGTERDDVDLYLALARANPGPVLELGAGSGRIAVPLAAAGHEVVALDGDAHMLERCRARWAATSHPAGRGSLDIVEADMTSYRAEPRHGLVLIAFNSLLLLDRDAQRAALATIAAALAPRGRLVLDVWLPAPEDLALYDGRLVLDWVRQDLESGSWVAKSSSARYSSASRTAEVTTFFDAWTDESKPAVRRLMRHDRVSFVTATELTQLAHEVGLAVETLAGDHEMNPFADESDRLVLVGRRGSD